MIGKYHPITLIYIYFVLYWAHINLFKCFYFYLFSVWYPSHSRPSTPSETPPSLSPTYLPVPYTPALRPSTSAKNWSSKMHNSTTSAKKGHTKVGHRTASTHIQSYKLQFWQGKQSTIWRSAPRIIKFLSSPRVRWTRAYPMFWTQIILWAQNRATRKWW